MEPVVIERHGRPRAAIVSIDRFRLYEKLVARYSREVSLALLAEATEHIADGHLGAAVQLRKDAVAIGGFAALATDRGKRI